MNIDIAPSSSELVPSHRQWDEMRVSSHMITRRACARGGGSTPTKRSTAIA